MNELRTKTGEHIRKKLPGDIGALAAALVTDERRAISEDTTKSLRRSGLAHIIAISGLNMTIAAGIFSRHTLTLF
ncbi:ComEC/Rec2 family competence protein [Candidatus Liberibacter sp.]|uniref:ComEC/Rec2 family competence protein n=1 Tax=Candidatus Liberibacter sp. TaxID=34022 RepID=UPI0015F650D0|nr:ComEC/Rec2 family competence protein [Candidatus Liberibacter sp.]MBA5723795.1 ComEC family DNA internalization-related competence protein [Candidatus Liberibacter sp.]